MQSLDTKDADFDSAFGRLLDRASRSAGDVEPAVRAIIDRVRDEGDPALLEFTRQFDQRLVDSVAELEISAQQLSSAADAVDATTLEALQHAVSRVREYHQHQRQESWQYTEADGTVLGQQITPLDRVGLYVPGGKAAYPSSVIMTAVPAQVAGVRELIMVVPMPRGEINQTVLAAASLLGVDRVFTVGGAQAIAALAYGTDTIPAVDKIVGPGNIYVTTAKRLVFGQTGIDMLAGPSEVVVVCDQTANPDWVAMDLFAQAEHDEWAQSIVISWDQAVLDAVQASVERLLPTLERRDIVETALRQQGAGIRVRSRDEAVAVIDRIAPEHLELMVDDPRSLADAVRHAGAIFVGAYSAEVLGDYCAGPNHVLPTSRTARFSSPLGVYDFQKRSSLIQCSAAGAAVLSKTASALARVEGLTAHARSAEYRAGGSAKK